MDWDVTWAFGLPTTRTFPYVSSVLPSFLVACHGLPGLCVLISLPCQPLPTRFGMEGSCVLLPGLLSLAHPTALCLLYASLPTYLPLWRNILPASVPTPRPPVVMDSGMHYRFPPPCVSPLCLCVPSLPACLCPHALPTMPTPTYPTTLPRTASYLLPPHPYHTPSLLHSPLSFCLPCPFYTTHLAVYYPTHPQVPLPAVLAAFLQQFTFKTALPFPCPSVRPSLLGLRPACIVVDSLYTFTCRFHLPHAHFLGGLFFLLPYMPATCLHAVAGL